MYLLFHYITLIVVENDTYQFRLSSGGISGVLEQQRNNGAWSGICVEQATFKEIQLICRHLGFEQPNRYMYAYLNESNNPGIWNFIYFSEEDQQELQWETIDDLTVRPHTFSECLHNSVLHIVCQNGKKHPVFLHHHPVYVQYPVFRHHHPVYVHTLFFFLLMRALPHMVEYYATFLTYT